MFKIISMVVALGAVAVAGYAVYSGQAGGDRLAHLEQQTSLLEARIGGIIKNIKANDAARRGPAEAQVPGEVYGRLAALERKLAALGAPPGAHSPDRLAADSASEAIRRIVREEQAAAVRKKEQESKEQRQKFQEKWKKLAEKSKEKQEKQLQDWVKKFSDEAGLTIAQEEGILRTYEWAKAERDRLMKDKMKEDGAFMLGPEDFKKVGEERDRKIKDLLSEQQFKELKKYRSKNPRPEQAFAIGAGDDDGEGTGLIIQGMSIGKKEEPKPEEKDENK